MLTSTPNFRAVEALPAADGRQLRRGLVYRAEAVVDPGEHDRRSLAAAGIALVFDLRSGDERQRVPNAWWRSAGVEIDEHDILADIRGAGAAWDVLRRDPSAAGGRAVMLDIYAKLPEAAAPHFAAIVGRIAGGDLPVLIHCTAGKDRTGFVVAALLRLLGVPMAAIVDDYLLSADRINARVAEATRALILTHVGFAVPDAACAALTGVSVDYLARSFAVIDAEWKSFDGWVAAAGIDAAATAALRDRLLEPAG